MSYPELEADQPLHTSAAEENVAALEKTLASRGDDAKGEAEVRRQLVRVQKELDKYRAVYGDASSLPPETAQLSEQLQRKQDELDRLQLQDKQREQAETAIYSELDKLSAAWESLEKQLKKKVYDLSAADERIGKVNLEVCVPATSSAPRLMSSSQKAKAENKFFLCMRDKDASDGERKRLAQNLDRAAKAIEKLGETEKNLSSRIVSLSISRRSTHISNSACLGYFREGDRTLEEDSRGAEGAWQCSRV